MSAVLSSNCCPSSKRVKQNHFHSLHPFGRFRVFYLDLPMVPISTHGCASLLLLIHRSYQSTVESNRSERRDTKDVLMVRAKENANRCTDLCKKLDHVWLIVVINVDGRAGRTDHVFGITGLFMATRLNADNRKGSFNAGPPKSWRSASKIWARTKQHNIVDNTITRPWTKMSMLNSVSEKKNKMFVSRRFDNTCRDNRR